MIRRLRVGDALSLLLPGSAGNQAVPHECIGRDTSAPWWAVRALRHGLGNPGQHGAWVEISGWRVRGVAAARRRSGPRAWEVEYLSLRPEAQEAGADLLEALSVHAGRCGTERLFLRTLAGSPVGEIAQRSGFFPCIREELRVHPGPRLAGKQPRPSALREVVPADDYPLFRLYHAATPPEVRSAQGLTYDQWHDAQERCGGQQVRLAWVEGESLRAMVRYGRRGGAGYLESVAHPEMGEALGEVVDYVVGQLPPQRRLLCLLPSYATGLAQTLQERGFDMVATYCLWVKPTASPVTEPSLAPARA